MSKVERFRTVGRLGGPRAWARGQLERGGERSGGAAAARRRIRSFAAPRCVGERQRLKPLQVKCNSHADK